MKICAVCETAFSVGGGKGPKSHPVLCAAHYFRFRRGSKSWKDPSIRGHGVHLARIRISEGAKENLDALFKKAKRKRPALCFHEFFDDLVIYDADTEDTERLGTVMSAHTPGPWETSVNDEGQWDVCAEGGGDMVADLSASEHGEADACLIAAAPDLLATLKALAEWGPLAESLDVAEFRVDVANALAAIAKAGGES